MLYLPFGAFGRSVVRGPQLICSNFTWWMRETSAQKWSIIFRLLYSRFVSLLLALELLCVRSVLLSVWQGFRLCFFLPPLLLPFRIINFFVHSADTVGHVWFDCLLEEYRCRYLFSVSLLFALHFYCSQEEKVYFVLRHRTEKLLARSINSSCMYFATRKRYKSNNTYCVSECVCVVVVVRWGSLYERRIIPSFAK